MSSNRIPVEESYIKLAEMWANDRSYCKRQKVGALVVRDGHIISDGFNGTPSGFPNVCELPSEHTDPALMHTDPIVLHAESNALMKLATSTQHSVGATLYQTLSPCFECAKLIIQAKIVKVVYKTQYRDTAGIELLKKAKIEIVQLSDISSEKL